MEGGGTTGGESGAIGDASMAGADDANAGAADAGEPGVAGAGSEGGAAGGGGGAAGSEGGAAGGPDTTPDDPGTTDTCPGATIVPECFLYGPNQYYPRIAVPVANGIGISGWELFGGVFHIFASKQSTSMMAFADTPTPADSWGPWTCFDWVPRPSRVAAGTLGDSFSEVFVTTECGQLYRRRDFLFGTTQATLPWQQFSLPAVASFITDVAVSASSKQAHYVYVADRGSVFVRHQTDDDPNAPYGRWSEIPTTDSKLIAASVRANGRRQVFKLDSHGLPSTALQAAADLDADFGSWADFGTRLDSSDGPLHLVDIEASRATILEVFGLDAAGNLWEREESIAGSDDFSPWHEWDGPAPPAQLVEVAVAALNQAEGQPLQLVGLTGDGAVYVVRRTAGSWDQWHQIP